MTGNFIIVFFVVIHAIFDSRLEAYLFSVEKPSFLVKNLSFVRCRLFEWRFLAHARLILCVKVTVTPLSGLINLVEAILFYAQCLMDYGIVFSFSFVRCFLGVQPG
jgi:hypothetical protein